MTDNSQEPQRRKRQLIAPLVIALGVVLILVFATLTKTRPPAPAPTPPPEVVIPPPPLVEAPPAPPPPATRGDIIDRASVAADAYSRANAPPPGKDPLVKRTFRIRLPFGCGGPRLEPGAAQAWYQIDAARRTVRLTARPAVWTSLPLVQGLEGSGDIEAVEGFWITRPWSRSETCAPGGEQPATPTAAASPARETLGLARIFSKGESRVVRRNGRPYELVRKLPDSADLAAPRAYSLVLEGRIVGFADGQATRCWSPSADLRPVCLLAVEFDRVAFEDAAGVVLAEWDS
ncbi:MAG: hypothetical protein K9G59_00995 [Caulobacter sp.]|nr:hypothetical protein [Caulobacter sp.]